ncbi:hypothetical protein PS710_01199 [Pseudomonas fluorescens]|uniref:RNA polymerase sigma-70 region 2 domain-containing protein n=1 Tax=Pseudomonas fluorescens TaxID=294 RepID=A0A5E7B944_PSEFL|nr:hypothetical protein PS710_01199 [Pseudomonas fluorescens]
MSQSRFNHVFIAQRVSLLRTLERMVNNHSTAEDLLQETYLRVTRALSERAIDHLEPFVFQTARNLALDHLRARRIHSRTLLDDVPLDVVQAVASPVSSAEDAVHAEQLLERLNLASTDSAPVSSRFSFSAACTATVIWKLPRSLACR